MKIFGKTFFEKPAPSVMSARADFKSQNNIEAYSARPGSWGQSYSVVFDGEKTLGEIGPAKNYLLDYATLRTRSWQSYLENDLSKTILDKFAGWIIGKGLILQATPNKTILKAEGINFDSQKVNQLIEARFSIFSKSKKSTFNRKTNLNSLMKEIFKHGKIGGDCVVCLRFTDNFLTVEMYDGEHLSQRAAETIPKEHSFSNGVETDKNGRHYAFHIKTKDGKVTRLLAINKATGLTQTFIYFGSKYRIDNERGVPVISTVLETLSKLERYKEAAVGSAEERQKIALFVEHLLGSDGENPLIDQITAAFDANNEDGGQLPVDELNNQLANKIATSTNKTAFNLTPGSTIKSIESKNEMFFQEFWSTNANIICACLNIPPNVAFSLYTDSFSASRAATKDWEHTMDVERADFQFQVLQPIFDFWIHIEVLTNKINIPGYLSAFQNQDEILLGALRSSRFTGSKFPHIDPLKEVQAERLKLGEKGKNIPLTTAEDATEALNSGDYYSNVERFSEELKISNEIEGESEN